MLSYLEATHPACTQPPQSHQLQRQSFHHYIAVDWSAKNTPSPARPSADAIWVGCGSYASAETEEHYFRTRTECVAFLTARLQAHASAGKRTLVGYDFGLGFPAGFARALGYRGKAPWQFTWRTIESLIEDTADNKNNRFEAASKLNEIVAQKGAHGPFWGCPSTQKLARLKPTSPKYPFETSSGTHLANKRICEQEEARAQPMWKLLGVGSVGGQSLVGIPAVMQLRNDASLKSVSRVWPFETGFDSTVLDNPNIRVVHLEIWPSLLADHLDPTCAIRDQAQVRAVVSWMRAHDRKGRLPALFSPPTKLTALQIKAITQEEGWVLGAGLTPGGSDLSI